MVVVVVMFATSGIHQLVSVCIVNLICRSVNVVDGADKVVHDERADAERHQADNGDYNDENLQRLTVKPPGRYQYDQCYSTR